MPLDAGDYSGELRLFKQLGAAEPYIYISPLSITFFTITYHHRTSDRVHRSILNLQVPLNFSISSTVSSHVMR